MLLCLFDGPTRGGVEIQYTLAKNVREAEEHQQGVEQTCVLISGDAREQVQYFDILRKSHSPEQHKRGTEIRGFFD